MSSWGGSDNKNWWDKDEGNNFKSQRYENFKEDSFKFKETETSEEYRGERKEWKQYDGGYYDNEKEWGDYDYKGKDSEGYYQDKEWGFDKEEWDASMGESADSFKWEEDEYKGQSSEEYKEDYKGKEGEYSYYDGDSKKNINSYSSKDNEDSEYWFEQFSSTKSKGSIKSKDGKEIKNNKKQSDIQTYKDNNKPDNGLGGLIEYNTTTPNNMYFTYNNNCMTGLRIIQQQKNEEDEIILHDPSQRYIKPKREDYSEISLIWIVVLLVLITIRYCTAIKRIVKSIKVIWSFCR